MTQVKIVVKRPNGLWTKPPSHGASARNLRQVPQDPTSLTCAFVFLSQSTLKSSLKLGLTQQRLSASAVVDSAHHSSALPPLGPLCHVRLHVDQNPSGS